MSRFLRLFFGCHGRADRSFFWKSTQFPICARCTGELCGMILTIPIMVFFGYVPMPKCFILMIPLLIDGTLQLKTSWVSNNTIRLFTGILFGIAVGFILISIHVFLVKLAIMLLRKIAGNYPYYNYILNNLDAKILI